MRRELHYFDIYPKTVPAGNTSKITIKSTGSHLDFKPGETYRISVIPMNENPLTGGILDDFPEFTVISGDCEINFEYLFGNEQEYRFRIFYGGTGNFIMLSVYALNDDLYNTIPLKGDLHVHSSYSDGAETPERVVANYRGAGYDFVVISDHEDYLASVRAKEYFKNVPVDMTIFNGEEIHSPGNPIHIVNFAGKQSVQAMADSRTCGYMENLLGIEDPTEKITASCRWVCENIRKTGGLAIFAHPFWITDSYQVSKKLTGELIESNMFDAFELLGGLSPSENMMQSSFFSTYFFNPETGKYIIPIVGSSDSHGTVRESFKGSNMLNPVENDYGFFDYYTIVFAENNSESSIISSIRNGYTVAVNNVDAGNPLVYGNFRFLSYAVFLLSEYFPLHQQDCFEEGKAMKEYIAKNDASLKLLELYRSRTQNNFSKYFGQEIPE